MGTNEPVQRGYFYSGSATMPLVFLSVALAFALAPVMQDGRCGMDILAFAILSTVVIMTLTVHFLNFILDPDRTVASVGVEYRPAVKREN